MDTLDRLRNKKDRSLVTPRRDSLLPSDEQTESPNPLPGQITLDDLRKKVEAIPPTVRRSAVVLEEGINDVIDDICRRRNRITLEVLIEAFIVHFEDLPKEAQAKILAEAKRRYSRRKKVGEWRRTLALAGGIEKDG